MYIPGMYFVSWEINDPERPYRISNDFPTEQEARVYGNELWKNPDVTAVYINRRAYYKKRRHSILIAQAKK